jgi:methylmalonyl-CoA mutase cobalamin-binding subunit
VPARAKAQPVKVLCLPLRNETDELGAMMLAQLLEAEGVQAVAISARRADEMLATVAEQNPDVLFLSGLPPFAMARAHRLYRSVRGRYPHLRMMIGIWGYIDDGAKAAQKITRGDPVHVSTTVTDAVAQVRDFRETPKTVETVTAA